MYDTHRNKATNDNMKTRRQQTEHDAPQPAVLPLHRQPPQDPHLRSRELQHKKAKQSCEQTNSSKQKAANKNQQSL
jgi:hypothetical protein